jgi:hypothetical protein
MIHTHSVGRALQYFPQHTALLREGKAVTFLELDIRVREIAAALRRCGFLYLCANRTCEVWMEHATHAAYESFVYALEELTRER